MKTNNRRGVTLVELMVAMTLGILVIGAVMSVYTFISKSAVRISNYNDMEREATLGLERLGRELRMAQSVVSSGNPITQITLSVPDAVGTGSHAVVYAYNASPKTLTRRVGSDTQVIVRDIQPGSFSFKRFDKMQQSLDLPGAVLPDYSTKQLQITLTINPETHGLVASTTKRVISSRFVLRNL